MGKKQNNAYGGAVGGGVAQPTVPPSTGGATSRRHKGKGNGKGNGDGSDSTKGMQGDPNNPYNTGIPGNITSPAGGDNAAENPDDFWTWSAAKSGLNVNPMAPFGAWMGKQNDFYQSLFGAAKLDNPNLQFPNFMGGYGFGSPTPPDPKPTGNGKGAKNDQTGGAPDSTGAATGDATGGNKKKHKGGRR